jgi:hypothetical protein
VKAKFHRFMSWYLSLDLNPTVMETTVFLVMAFLCAMLAAGCGASAKVRAEYTAEQAHCLFNERAIIDDARECMADAGTDCAEVADDAMAVERARCARELQLIEGGQ